MTFAKWLFFGLVPSSVLADLGLTVLRVFAGLSMALAHGWGKIQGPPEQFVTGVGELGFPAPAFFAWMAAVSEFGGGLLLAAGAVTRISAFFLLGTMLVAGLLYHGLHSGDPYADMERALLYAAISFAFMLTGSGRFSVDGMLR